MQIHIDNNTTIDDLKHICTPEDESIMLDFFSYITDPRVAVWAIEHHYGLSILLMDLKLINDARIILAMILGGIDLISAAEVIQIDQKWLQMSFNEIYMAAMVAHLNDPAENWSFDIKRKLYIDHDTGTIYGYDADKDIWRQYT